MRQPAPNSASQRAEATACDCRMAPITGSVAINSPEPPGRKHSSGSTVRHEVSPWYGLHESACGRSSGLGSA